MAPDPARTRAVVVTVSDRGAAGERADTAGPILATALAALGTHVTTRLVADGAAVVESALRSALADGARIIVTTGGTGIGPRDQTPDGTRAVLSRELPGIAERLRAVDAATVPASALSRGLAGLSAGPAPAIIVNVAGSEGAARSAARILTEILPHALSQLDGGDHS